MLCDVFHNENAGSVNSILIPYRHREKAKPYEEAIRAAGLNPVAVSVSGSRPELNGCSGLLLAGGTDVNPLLYGQAAVPETEAPDEERDQFELALLHLAEEKAVPILAICRGMQLLNVFYGGSLIQHLGLPMHDVESQHKGERAHSVEITPQSKLLTIARVPRWEVNSRHHQAVDVLGRGLRMSACSPTDNVVEAVETEGERFVVAVQWHPEDQIKDYPQQLSLFQSFAEAVSRQS
jgi:putative glutamine amidotransferase